MARVLIADDAMFLRGMVKRMLEAHGHTVVAEAANGREAVDQFRLTKPDVVLLDITMPDMDGIEAMRYIRSIDPTAKVVVCTALVHQKMIETAIESGVDGFIVKPFDEEKLVNTVEKLCESKDAQVIMPQVTPGNAVEPVENLFAEAAEEAQAPEAAEAVEAVKEEPAPEVAETAETVEEAQASEAAETAETVEEVQVPEAAEVPEAIEEAEEMEFVETVDGVEVPAASELTETQEVPEEAVAAAEEEQAPETAEAPEATEEMEFVETVEGVEVPAEPECVEAEEAEASEEEECEETEEEDDEDEDDDEDEESECKKYARSKAKERKRDLADVAHKTMSRKAYMKKWRNLTDEEVEEELRQIAYEMSWVEKAGR